jgi:membrane associated rhomboid family serine protease
MAKQDRTIVVNGQQIAVDFNEDRRPEKELTYIIWLILGAFVATWMFQQFNQWFGIAPLQTIADAVWDAGYLDNKVYDGQVWRFITHMFLHGGYLHLLGNLLGLWSFAVFARNCFSKKGWLFVYFAGGIAAALLQLAFATSADFKMVGASGGIMAIWGATITATIRFRQAPANERPWEHVVPLMTSVKWLAFQFIFEQFISNVGHWAHFGGLVAGLAIGAVLSLRAAPAVLASSSGKTTISKLHISKTRDDRTFIQALALQLKQSFDAATDFIVVEWEAIDAFNRRHFAYEVIAGTAPTGGVTSRHGLVELVNPYTCPLLQEVQSELPDGALVVEPAALKLLQKVGVGKEKKAAA